MSATMPEPEVLAPEARRAGRSVAHRGGPSPQQRTHRADPGMVCGPCGSGLGVLLVLGPGEIRYYVIGREQRFDFAFMHEISELTSS